MLSCFDLRRARKNDPAILKGRKECQVRTTLQFGVVNSGLFHQIETDFDFQDDDMNYRKLGKVGPSVSELSLGTMVFGWKTPTEECARIVDAAIDAGVNLIDTSNSYGKGASEEILGRILAGEKRTKVLLATKFHYWKEGDDLSSKTNIRNHIICQCEESLRRLRTDVIDLYQLHRPSSSVPIEETLLALDQLVQAGKVRWIGTSTFAAWQIVEALWISNQKALVSFACEQAPYNLLDRTVERELLPMAQTFGLGVLGYCPLAEGLLTGKYRRDQPLPEDSRFARVTDPKPYLAKLTPSVFDVIERLSELARNRRISLPTLVLAWCKSRKAVSSFILGPSNLLQFAEGIRALDIELGPSDCLELDEISRPGLSILPYYSADFGPHAFRPEAR